MKILWFRFGKDRPRRNKFELIDRKGFTLFTEGMDKEDNIRSVECTMTYLSDMLSIKIDDLEKLVTKDNTDNKKTGLQLIEDMKRFKDAFDTERKLIINEIENEFNIKHVNDMPYIG